MANTYNFKEVTSEALVESVTKAPTRGRVSEGAILLEEFRSSGLVSAEVNVGTKAKRDSLALSAGKAVRDQGLKVWVRKLGGSDGTTLLFVDVAKAPKAVKDAYEARPKGRTKAS